jgi:hypothetical protein
MILFAHKGIINISQAVILIKSDQQRSISYRNITGHISWTSGKGIQKQNRIQQNILRLLKKPISRFSLAKVTFLHKDVTVPIRLESQTAPFLNGVKSVFFIEKSSTFRSAAYKGKDEPHAQAGIGASKSFAGNGPKPFPIALQRHRYLFPDRQGRFPAAR